MKSKKKLVPSPAQFFSKKKEDNISYNFEEKIVLPYIKKHLSSSEFILIQLIGPSQIGKSTLLEILSGVKHQKGNSLTSITKGATIVYGGKIKTVYERLKLDPPDDEFSNIDVFFIDTEGIYDDKEKGSIASLLIPLLIVSTKNVILSESRPSNELSSFLSICKSFINISDDYDKLNDPFTNKLIVRFKDFPDEIGKNVNQTIAQSIKLIEEESVVVKNFHDQSMFPIFIPGGPWSSDKKCHNKYFNKYFLDALFAPNENLTIYSNTNKFIEDIKFICKIGDDNCSRILRLFKEKTVAEKILDFFCIELEQSIDIFFNNLMQDMSYDEEEIDIFFNRNILVKLCNVVEKNSISDEYYRKYLKMEEDYYNKKEKELKIVIERYKNFKKAIEDAKSNKEILCEKLKYLSNFISECGNSAAETIFYNTRTHFTPIKKYENIIISAINLKKTLCIKQLRNSDIFIDEIDQLIFSDINMIFNILLKFKEFSFYRQHGFISKILSFFFDKEKIKTEAHEIEPNSNVWGFVNLYNGKFSFIVVDVRNYISKSIDIINVAIKDEINENLDEDQKNILTEYIEKYNMESISNLSEEQIKKFTTDQIKSLMKE